RDAHVLDHRLPLSCLIFHLEIREYKPRLRLLGSAEERAAVRPVDPAGEDEDGPAVRSRVAEVQVEGVQLGDPRGVAAEAVRIDSVAGEQALAHVGTVAVPGANRPDLLAHAEQPELGE